MLQNFTSHVANTPKVSSSRHLHFVNFAIAKKIAEDICSLSRRKKREKWIIGKVDTPDEIILTNCNL